LERTFKIISIISGIIVGNRWNILSTIECAICSSYWKESWINSKAGSRSFSSWGL